MDACVYLVCNLRKELCVHNVPANVVVSMSIC